MRPLLAVAVLASLAGCGDNEAPPCRGGYHVCRQQLRDGDGRALILRGVNLAGSHKQAPYTDPFTPADYAQLHAWGFRAIRYLIVWAAVEPTQGHYDDAYLDRVATHLRWAHDAGLGVILDMHQDVYGEGFGFDGAPRWTCDEAYYKAFVPRDPWSLNYTDPNVLACVDHLWTDLPTRHALALAWRHVAERLGDQPAVIGFDPLNEPHWGTAPVPSFERDRLRPFYDDAIAEVRAVAPWVVFAEPSSSRNLGFATRLAPFDVPDVVYAPHLYDPSAELAGHFDPAARDSFLAIATDLRADADRLGLPLWIGEYGGIGADPQIGAYMDAAYDGAAAALGGTTYWAFDRGGGYAMLDPQGHEVTPIIDAIVRPYPVAVAGDPIDWAYDDAGRVLTVSWRPDPTVTAPTVIVTPARVYPDGVTVDCGGCAVEVGDGEVHLGPVAGAVAHATIAPR
jgi:endoglycosylceramidase